MMDEPELEKKVRQYGLENRIRVYTRAGRIGSGHDGAVWSTSRRTAVKAIHRLQNYMNELECYTRFHRAGVEKLGEFAVPRLVGFSDALQVIEMQIVVPPFILDFGKVWLDIRPDYPEETWVEWRMEKEELFEENWPKVRALMAELIRRFGIYYMDPKPGNISFAEPPQQGA